MTVKPHYSDAYETNHPMTRRSNGIMRMYQQFPNDYSSFAEMTEQLADVAKMGFNSVWVSQFFETGNVPTTRMHRLTGEKVNVAGSIYGMAHPERISDHFAETLESQEAAKAAICNYTATAREHGLVPMADIVINHIALDSPIAQGGKHMLFGREVDTSKWFGATHKQWDDVVELNYDDPTARQEILDYYWKPFVKQLYDMGFRGFRFDAAAYADPAVQHQLSQYIYDLFKENHEPHPPMVLSELLFSRGNSQQYVDNLKQMGVTHVTNSAYWGNPTPALRAEGANEGWKGDKKWLGGNIQLLQEVVHMDRSGKVHTNRLTGGTISFCGNHDQKPVGHAAICDGIDYRMTPEQMAAHKALPRYDQLTTTWEEKKAFLERVKTDPEAQQEMREAIRNRIAFSALVPDGGWYLLAGDEYGNYKPQSPFIRVEAEEYVTKTQYQDRWGGMFDFKAFVTETNEILKSLPRSRFGQWTELMLLEDQPHLFIAVRHNGKGFRGNCDVILMNAAPEKGKPVITEKMMESITHQALRHSGGKMAAANAIRQATLHFSPNSFDVSSGVQTHWNITHAGTPSIAEFGYAEELTPAGLKLNDPTLKRGEAYLDMRDMLLRDAKLGTIAI